MVGIIDRKLSRKPRRKLGRERRNVRDGLDCFVILPRNDMLEIERSKLCRDKDPLAGREDRQS